LFTVCWAHTAGPKDRTAAHTKVKPPLVLMLVSLSLVRTH
jgi:hypothetical protein